MLSLGTEAARALSIAVASVMFAFGSPLPPSRAATSTNRISLANSLLRLASAAPFFRLIVAHFEWPDISHLPEEVLVEPWLPHQLRMEGCHDKAPLLQDDGRAFVAREDPDLGPDVAHDRRPDEHPAHEVVDALDVQVGLERVDLPAVGVALDRYVHEGKQRLETDHSLGHDDHPGAGAEHRHPGACSLQHGFDESGRGRELGDRGALAAGDRQHVDAREVLRRTDLYRRGADIGEHTNVLAEVTLQREDPRPHAELPPSRLQQTLL